MNVAILVAAVLGGLVLVAASATYLFAKAAYWNVRAELAQNELSRRYSGRA